MLSLRSAASGEAVDEPRGAARALLFVSSVELAIRNWTRKGRGKSTRPCDASSLRAAATCAPVAGVLAGPAIRGRSYDLLAELREEGTTILLVDQMAALALSVADRAYVLQSGTIRQSGSAADLRSDPALVKAYLGELEKSS
jgi:hypothetical protein